MEHFTNTHGISWIFKGIWWEYFMGLWPRTFAESIIFEDFGESWDGGQLGGQMVFLYPHWLLLLILFHKIVEKTPPSWWQSQLGLANAIRKTPIFQKQILKMSRSSAEVWSTTQCGLHSLHLKVALGIPMGQDFPHAMSQWFHSTQNVVNPQ